MIGFWAIAGAMTLAAVAFVAARLVFPRRGPVHAEPRQASLACLRAAWGELDRDCAVGLVPEDQREAARAELARRAEEELDANPPPPAAPRRPARIAALVAAALIPVAAYALYQQLGSPEAIGNAQAFARLEGPLTPGHLPAFREQLARHLADNPGDGRGWAILGRVDLELERYATASLAFARAVKASHKVARDPEVWVDYAEATGMAEGRTLLGRPAQLIATALELDPANPRALDLAGSLAAEQGDHANAARHWKLLLDRLDAGDPRRPQLERAIARVEGLAPQGGMTKP